MDKTKSSWWRTISYIASLSATCWHARIPHRAGFPPLDREEISATGRRRDIVVSDLRLPDGNGIDLLRWMRKEAECSPLSS